MVILFIFSMYIKYILKLQVYGYKHTIAELERNKKWIKHIFSKEVTLFK